MSGRVELSGVGIYVRVGGGRVVRSIDLGELRVVVDVDEEGRIVGLEVLLDGDARRRLEEVVGGELRVLLLSPDEVRGMVGARG